MRLTEYHQLMQKKVKKHKYGAKPCIVTEDGTMFEVAQLKAFDIKVEGIRFDSKMEAEYYLILKAKLERDEIDALTLQPKYVLQEKPRVTYVADFEVMHKDGDPETIDIKGMQTASFRIKKRLFAKVYEDYKLTLVTKKNGRWMEVS